MKRPLAGLLGLVLAGSASAGVDTSIYDIQNGLIPLSDPVTAQGVVVTGVYFNGFFVQEPNMDAGSYAFGGIWVFNGSTPAVDVGDLVDVSGTYEEFFFESEIDITGGGSFTIVGTAPVPPVTVLNITDLNNGGSGAEPPGGWANGEQWEGVYVRCEQADMVATGALATGCFSASPTRWGVYQTSAPSESLFVRNSVQSHEIPIGGSPITYVQGGMSYHRCNRKVVPRDNDDVGYIGPPNIVWAYSTPTSLAGNNTTTMTVEFSRDVEETSAETVGNYVLLSGLTIMSAQRDDANPSLVHLTTMTQPDAVQDEIFVSSVQSLGGPAMPIPQSFQFYTGLTTIQQIQTVADPAVSDASLYLNGVVSTLGTATTSTVNTGTSDFSIGVDGGPGYTGLRVGLGGSGVDIGNRVRVSGTVFETFGRTTIDFAGFGTYAVLGNGTVPAPVTFPTPESLPYSDVGESEPYEDVLVIIEEAVVDTTEFSEFGEWWLLTSGAVAPGDSAKTDYIASGVANDFGWEPCVGNTILIRGIVEYSFSEYKVVPRMNGDISHLGFGPGCLVATGEVTSPFISNARNYPNPFNPTTTIEFTTPADGFVKLEIYDAQGRKVRTLIEGDSFQAGTHTARWDGRNDAGADLASGNYFYRIVLEGENLTNRMTLLK